MKKVLVLFFFLHNILLAMEDPSGAIFDYDLIAHNLEQAFYEKNVEYCNKILQPLKDCKAHKQIKHIHQLIHVLKNPNIIQRLCNYVRELNIEAGNEKCMSETIALAEYLLETNNIEGIKALIALFVDTEHQDLLKKMDCLIKNSLGDHIIEEDKAVEENKKITVITADGDTIDLFNDEFKFMETLQNAYCDNQNLAHEKDDATIPLIQATTRSLQFIASLSKDLCENDFHLHSDFIIKKLKDQDLSDDAFIELFNAANFLEFENLKNCCVQVLMEKTVAMLAETGVDFDKKFAQILQWLKSLLKKLPDDLSNQLGTAFIENSSEIKKLVDDIPPHTKSFKLMIKPEIIWLSSHEIIGMRENDTWHDYSIYHMDLTNRETIKKYVGHKGAINSLCLSPDATCFASASDDGSIRLWDISTGNNLVTFRNPSGQPCQFVHFLPNKVSLLALCKDAIYIFDSPTGAIIHQTNIPLGLSPIAEVIPISCGGEKLIFKVFYSESGNPVQHVNSFYYDTTTLKNIEQLRGGLFYNIIHTENLMITSDGAQVLVAKEPSLIALKDFSQFNKLKKGILHNRLKTLCESPDHRMLATLSWFPYREPRIIVWDMHTNKTIKRFFEQEFATKKYKSTTHDIKDCCFSNDGKLFCVITDYKNELESKIEIFSLLRVFNTNTWDVHYELSFPSVNFMKIPFSPDNKMLVGYGKDKLLRCLRLDGGEFFVKQSESLLADHALFLGYCARKYNAKEKINLNKEYNQYFLAQPDIVQNLLKSSSLLEENKGACICQ